MHQTHIGGIDITSPVAAPRGRPGGRGILLAPIGLPPSDNCVIRLSAVKIVELLYVSIGNGI